MTTPKRPTADDLEAMLTRQLERDAKHEHKMNFVRWVGSRAEYQCRCDYTYLANH